MHSVYDELRNAVLERQQQLQQQTQLGIPRRCGVVPTIVSVEARGAERAGGHW